MKNTLEHVGYSIESESFDLKQLQLLDEMVTHSINEHIEKHDGLYTPKDIAVLSHTWRRTKWVEACESSDGNITFKTR